MYDGKLCFSEKERGKVWKDYVGRIVNEENDWDRNADRDAVEGPVVCVSREEALQALNEMKTGSIKELIAGSGGVGIQVIAERCEKVLDGFGMPAEWTLSIEVPILNGR